MGGGGGGSGKERARVCYRYRATWPRGDRDNGSPPLLSPRRFASPRTYIPSHPFQLAPLRLADSYFRATSRTRQAFPAFPYFPTIWIDIDPSRRISPGFLVNLRELRIKGRGEKGSSTRNRRDRSFWIRSRDREIGEFMAPFQRGIREYSD